MKRIEMLSLALLGILFFVWPVPHTVSVRDLLLVLNLALFGYLAWVRRGSGAGLRELSAPALVLAGLTAWMYAVVFFIFPENTWSLGEIQSQWWRALAALLIGAFAAISARDNRRLTVAALAVLVAALAVHVLYVDFQAMQGLLKPGQLERMAGLTEGPDKSNYLTNVLFGFLLAELFFRAVYGERVLPLSNTVFAAALALTSVSVFAERTRNGMITLVLMLLLLGWFYLRARQARLNRLVLASGIVAMFAIVLGGAALVVSARQSSSLHELIDTIPIAWDTEHHREWQEDNPASWPKLPNGQTVDVSVYQRVAWFKEGLLLVRDHPLGIGFGRNAFGHGLEAKYGKGGGHSHSGLLDMAIGLGVPGALLWLGFFASLAVIAWRRCRAGANYAAILTLLVLTDYGARMLLDSVIRDHMLQQFMFLTGLAGVMMTASETEKGTSPT
ncbi:MAG TPA: O-antigen ligase family protein [Candidatus Methylomirabilis sp.]|nr:O-antigen ligase family protein [Candidatus Methylomirabilis sp.]